MAKAKRGKKDDILFEGVVIPKGTRSGKLAAKRITTTEEMAKFLIAVFSDTLTGKIKLPPPTAPTRVSAKMLNGLEQKLRHGLPVTIQATESGIRKSTSSKVKQSKEKTGPP